MTVHSNTRRAANCGGASLGWAADQRWVTEVAGLSTGMQGYINCKNERSVLKMP